MSGAVLEGAAHRGALDLACDVAVVGSGAGGAVVATELAEAGLDVVVLEEGPHVPAERYGRMRPTESLRHLWRDAGMTAALGLGRSPVINVTMGRCVGGSSVLTGGVCFRTPEAVLDTWVREHGLADLGPGSLDALYADVERAIHVEEVPAAMRSGSTRRFAEGAARLGYELKPLRRNTKGCDGCGRCNFGCPHGAKLSVDLSYLPRALARGARVVSDALVDRVLVDGDRAVGVTGRLSNGPRGRAGDRFTVRARRVVVAAGGVHSPLVLRASGVRSRHLGRHLTLHPSFKISARFDEDVRGWAGAMQSAWSDAFEHERVTLVGVFVPPSIIAATLPGFGPEHAERAERMAQMAMMGALIHDEGGGRVRRVPGREPLITYRMAKRDRAAVPVAMRRVAETWFAAGAREVFLPVLGHPPITADELGRLDLSRIPASRLECASQHPLGSCRMGTSADRSVVDPEGRVWGVRELYVADGSVVPTSLGVNPQLTIMTLATRTARRMLERPLPA